MTLFEIPDGAYSHPDYYPLKLHVMNIAKAFNDASHQKASWFHDLGKLNKRFQANIIDGGPLPYHALAGAYFFLVNNGMDFDRESFGVFLAILKHHGDLEDVQDLADDLMDEDSVRYRHPELFEALDHIQSALGLKIDFDLEACCELFDQTPFVKAYDLRGLSSYFQVKEIFSKLIFADKYEAIFKEPYRERLTIPAAKFQNRLLGIMEQKKNVLSPVRNAARLEVMKTFEAHRDKRIYFLEAPTGIGKTFTALQLALAVAERKNKKRIICALPMTSIIDQTHSSYAEIVDNNVLLKFHHLTKAKDYTGNNWDALQDQEAQKEKTFFRQKNDFLAASWGRDQVIVTTFNQILYAIFSNRNRDMIKYWALRDSVVIFDEIQAIPRVLLRDLAITVSFLSKTMDIDFILMSATIPAVKPILPADTWCDLLHERYFAMDFNNRYALRFDEEISTPQLLAEQIRLAAQCHRSVLCVVNTKKLALDIYNRVNTFASSEEVFLLSTLFIPRHRKAIIRSIQKRLAARRRTILVSTQVVEAGVDLDFDYGFREFAPLYSIIQTAGRINRENRAEIGQSATLVVTAQIGKCPYHATDLMQEEVSQLLDTQIRENEILPRLKRYFEAAISRTRQEPILIEPMKKLEYRTVMEKLDKHFMNTLPNMCPIFVEIRNGLYDRFLERRNQLLQDLKQKGGSLEQKMEYKSRLKRIDKCISGYVISVACNDAKTFPDFDNHFEMKVCPFFRLGDGDDGTYSSKEGWKGDSSDILF